MANKKRETFLEEEINELPAEPVEGAVADNQTEPVEGAVADNQTEPVEGAVADNQTEPVEGAVAEETTPENNQNGISEEEKNIKGYVTGTAALRVRYLPNLKSQEMGIIKKGDEVIISLMDSTEKFYSVRIGKLEGFCLKEFITIS